MLRRDFPFGLCYSIGGFYRLLGSHGCMNSGILCSAFLPPVGPRGLQRWGGTAAAIPQTADIVAWNNLGQATCFDVSDFDKAGVEKEDVWWVARHPLCCAFPLDGHNRSTWISMSVNVQAELWIAKRVRQKDLVEYQKHAVIAEQELILARPEHAKRLACF